MTTRSISRRLSLFTITAACAVALAACGGGGGGDDSPPAGTDPGTGGGTGNPTATEIRSLDQQAVANGNYAVNAASAGTVMITLPTAINVGDTVSVLGVGANEWMIRQNAGQFIATSNLGGNQAPGVAFTPLGQVDGFFMADTSQDGNVVIASTNNPISLGTGALYVSRDHGATFTNVGGTPRVWSGVDVSPNGQHMVAVEITGNIFVSHDGGTSFTPAAAGGQFLLGAAISDDGTKVVAAAKGGNLWVSSNGGTTFASVGGAAPWESVAVSADGTRVVAVASGSAADSGVFLSTNGGTSFTKTPAANGEYYRVAMSADGQAIVASENPGLVIRSIDGGTTWATVHGTPTTVVNQVSMSANGQVIALAIAGDAIQMSTNGGTTFTPVNTAAAWRAVAVSGDGNTLYAATSGATGGITYSQGNRTTVGTAGGVTGGQGETLILEYVGNGQFNVQSSTGTFVVQ